MRSHIPICACVCVCASAHTHADTRSLNLRKWNQSDIMQTGRQTSRQNSGKAAEQRAGTGWAHHYDWETGVNWHWGGYIVKEQGTMRWRMAPGRVIDHVCKWMRTKWVQIKQNIWRQTSLCCNTAAMNSLHVHLKCMCALAVFQEHDSINNSQNCVWWIFHSR